MKNYRIKYWLLNEAKPDYTNLTSTDRGTSNPMDALAVKVPVSGIDAAGESTAPPSNPSRGYIWEETIMDCIEQARKALFGSLKDGSMGGLNPTDTNMYDISIEAGTVANPSFQLGQNRAAKAELKLMPARFGSLRKVDLDEIHFDGNNFKWTWTNSDPIVQSVGNEVLNKMNADTDTKNWLKNTATIISDALDAEIAKGTFESIGIAKTKKVNMYAGKGISLKGSNLAKQAWKSVGGESANPPRAFKDVARVAKRNHSSADSNSFKISGSKWIEGMGKKADILLLGPEGDGAENNCVGKVFSLNDTFSRFFPIIDITDVSIALRIETRDVNGSMSLRMEATPGRIQNNNDGKQFNSGSDLYNILMRTVPGFESTFDTADTAVASAGQDNTVPQASVAGALQQFPGEHVDTPNADMGQAQLRYSRKSPLNPQNRKKTSYRGLGYDGKEIYDHRKRKYSITAKLLGKK